MSSANRFDYYAELRIEPTATSQEITAAYRRLALLCHPDRNPDDPTATASFQRLQEAYETLGDFDRKASYDASRLRPGQRPAAFYEDDDHESFVDSIIQRYFAGVQEAMARERAAFEAATRLYEAETEAQRRREEEERRTADRILREGRARLAAEQQRAAERKVRAEKRKEAEREAAARMAEQARQHADERAQQEHRWALHKAVTRPDKKKACLHSQFDGWVKHGHRRKPRCEECGEKRSMTTFGCPYCDIMVCPMCRDKLVKAKRDSKE
ncbi:DnaJ domain protein [Apiospora hydei]|uniref:DnaJ domain protein n=1 Tax=Apiospora hydei TaxID=1337664 RepID=A0ABR1XEF6_9PEZI